jgi:hypothetical protein
MATPYASLSLSLAPPNATPSLSNPFCMSRLPHAFGDQFLLGQALRSGTELLGHSLAAVGCPFDLPFRALSKQLPEHRDTADQRQPQSGGVLTVRTTVRNEFRCEQVSV